MTILLEVDDATLAFGGLQALGGVSLTVDEGAIVGLIVVGVGLAVVDWLAAARRVDADRWDRFLVALERDRTDVLS